MLTLYYKMPLKRTSKVKTGLWSLSAYDTDSEGEDKREEAWEERNSKLRDNLEEIDKGSSYCEDQGKISNGISIATFSCASSYCRRPKKRIKLVSYNDPDDPLSGNETDSEVLLESGTEHKENDAIVKTKNMEEVTQEDDEKEQPNKIENCWNGAVKLPPEPLGNCSEELQEKFNDLHRMKTEQGYDINRFIMSKKAFRNPSMFEKFILTWKIDELGTNLPPELYDGHLFGKESYYEELAKYEEGVDNFPTDILYTEW